MKILLIQTAFIGDVVLATALIEKLHAHHPQAEIHFLLARGNESLLSGNPYLKKVLAWDKSIGKYRNLLQLLFAIRFEKYDVVVNCHRFASSGFITAFSKAKMKIGYDKNPFHLLFTKSVPHPIGKKGDVAFAHEIERNQQLIAALTDNKAADPKLYPSPADYERVALFKQNKYVTIAPASVWFTKQLPVVKWVALIQMLPETCTVYLLGAAGDKALCEEITKLLPSGKVEILAGELTFLQTAALMKNAIMNYTNDSAPMHFASAMNANVTAFFCSTIPQFGFGPLSANSHVLESQQPLECRPCGLHGYRSCPELHFRCALEMPLETFLEK